MASNIVNKKIGGNQFSFQSVGKIAKSLSHLNVQYAKSINICLSNKIKMQEVTMDNGQKDQTSLNDFSDYYFELIKDYINNNWKLTDCGDAYVFGTLIISIYNNNGNPIIVYNGIFSGSAAGTEEAKNELLKNLKLALINTIC
jgi:hypothetical protein